MNRTTCILNDKCAFQKSDWFDVEEKPTPINFDQIQNNITEIDMYLRDHKQMIDERFDKIERQLEELTQAIAALGRKME